MTQPAAVSELAEVIDLDAIRARRSVREPFGWHSLLGANLSDARDGAAIIARLGGHPIAVHGAPSGVCTCHEGAACDKPGKHPVSKGWQHGPLDLHGLDQRLTVWPTLNLGWRMGPQPCGLYLVAIDVDGDRSLLEPVEREHGPLPLTLTAKTPRGWHFIYRVPDDRKVGNRVALATGVDVRGQGGQIVVSPSRHASGAAYRWIDAREPAVLT